MAVATDPDLHADAEATHRNRALDGLRGIAVFAVLCFHGGWSWAVGGYLGVDVFFVLSGYLVTRILVQSTTGGGRIDLRRFWARRAKRLLPALLVTFVGVAAYAHWLVAPGDRSAIRADVFATLFYVQNWHLIFSHAGYFAGFAAPSPLRHTWSLAIEEQWYLIWPLAVMVLAAYAARATRIAIVVACAMFSAILLAIVGWNDPGSARAYYGTDTRVQALLLGAALALAGASVLRRVPRERRDPLAATSIVVLVVLFVVLDGNSVWFARGGATLTAVVATVLVATLVRPGADRVKAALSVTPLVALGRISYAVYLFHWPIFLWLTPDRTGLGRTALFALRLIVTLGAATVSWFVIERPIANGTRPFRWVRSRPLVVVVLTVAHLDHTPENCADENLLHLCQQCHNRYDAPMRRAGIKLRAFAKRAIRDLFQ